MDQSEPDVTIIVPALNEEATIQELLDRLLVLPVSKQIIVVNDGSEDRTSEILLGYADKVTVLTNAARTGKGSAIRQALALAVGRVVVIQDADLEYVPEQLPMLVQPILAGEEIAVYGNRFHHGLPRDMALPNKIVNVLLAMSVRMLFWKKLSDEATCYKAVRRDVIAGFDLQCQRFEFCPEVTAKLYRSGYDIREVPIDYSPRSKTAGKKIRWTDAPEAFWTLWRYWFWKPSLGNKKKS